MLRTVLPERSQLYDSDTTPRFLQPLLSVFERSQNVHATVVRIVQGLGFDNFLYGASASAKLDQESKSYVFTTLSREWVALYDRKAYIEVDPRLSRALRSAIPFVWDYNSTYGQSPQVDRFLDDSLAHGVGSGVVLGLHAPRGVRVIVALSGPSPRIDAVQREAIIRNFGNIVIFAIYFHEIFMKAVVESGVAPAFPWLAT